MSEDSHNTGEKSRTWWTVVWVKDEDLYFRFRAAASQAHQSLQEATHEALRLYIEAGQT